MLHIIIISSKQKNIDITIVSMKSFLPILIEDKYNTIPLIKRSRYFYFTTLTQNTITKIYEYIKIDRDKSTFKSHRDFDSEIEMTFKHF